MNINFKSTNKFYPALWILLIFFTQLSGLQSFGQAVDPFNDSRNKLVELLKSKDSDKSLLQSIDKFYFKACDSLLAENIVVEDRPIKVILTRLFDESESRLNKRTVSPLRIPAVNTYFLETLKRYGKEPLWNLYREIGINQSAILESAFDGIPLGDSIGLIVGIREMLNNPYFISLRLDEPRYVPFRDTLLYYLTNGAPDILATKLAGNDPLYTSLVTNSSNATVRAVSQVTKDNYYDKVLPFGLAILENRITADSVRQLSLTPSAYYRAFVEETIKLYTTPDREAKAYLHRPISEINKVLANKFYISEINTLHDSPDKVRFQILNNLSARELYFLLIGGSGELYTSSFLYLYNKFIKETDKQGLSNFLGEMDYYQFGQFVTNVAVYGLVNNLIAKLSEEKFAELMGNYFRRVLSSQLTDNEIVLNAMTISEILNEVKHQPIVQKVLLAQIHAYENSKVKHDVMLRRMFAGFKNILMQKTDYIDDPTYDVLPVKRLQKNNVIVQVSFFYDDEDGKGSFESSQATYDKSLWGKKDLGNYIVFNSLSGNDMRVYMNKPMATPGSDSTQDEMLRAIAQEGLEITSFIHRGHSYHLQQSLRKITPSAQFVFLGSCGGYNEVLNVFQLNPDVNTIVTRNIGSKIINDPLLQKINEDLVHNRDIHWDSMWNEFHSKFTSKQAKDLFSSYIPPNKYIGVKFIRKVFDY